MKIDKLCKSYGQAEILRDIDLTIEDGAFVVLVGPSGCGKSTLLRMIAGLETVTSGKIRIKDKVVNDLPPAKRGIAMVFQSYALYPHIDVYGNMGFGLKFAGTPKAEIDRRVRDAARMLQLESLLQRKPRDLSGGQRQRVAIGRAIVREPEVFLFDEPLSNLDAALRVNTRIEIAKLHKLLKATIVYVTHDQVEAMTLADTIVVMNKGRIEQIGKPLDLYYHPRNTFVAGFIGSPAMNFLKATAGERDGDTLLINAQCGAKLRLPVKAMVAPGKPLTVGIRPEHLQIGDSGTATINGTIDIVERLGEVGYAYITLGGDETINVQIHGANVPGNNQPVTLFSDPAHFHVFDENGQSLTI